MCARKGEGGGVIQHDRDGSTALGSLELLMRPPSSPFLSLSLYAFSSPFFFFLSPLFPFPLSPLSSNLSLGLTPLPCLRVHSSLDPRLRDEQLVPRSFHSHSRIFIPTNNRNAVIAQLKELVSPLRYISFFSPPQNEPSHDFLPGTNERFQPTSNLFNFRPRNDVPFVIIVHV